MPIDKLRYKSYIKSRFKIQILATEEIERLEIDITPTDDNSIYCYTDGSKINDTSGCGFIYSAMVRMKNLKVKDIKD